MKVKKNVKIHFFIHGILDLGYGQKICFNSILCM